jgi:hypothetical protein
MSDLKRVRTSLNIPANSEVTFFNSNTEDTSTWLTEAADHFASTHTGLPDSIIINVFRRIMLHPDNWHSFKHGAISITLLSPTEQGMPINFSDNDAVAMNTAICVRVAKEDERTNDVPTE